MTRSPASVSALLAGLFLAFAIGPQARAATAPSARAGRQQPAPLQGDSTQRAVVNLLEVANRERLTARPDRPISVHEPLNKGKERESKPLPPGAYAPGDELSASRTAELTLASPALSASFLALDDDNTRIPPDTHGAVGPNHLMVTLNSQVRVQTRTGNLITTVSLNGFWAVFGHANVFDPRVYYDPYANRWLFIALTDFRAATSSLLVGASQTGDPTGGWNLYDIDIDSSNLTFGDYPNAGFNKNWLTTTVNMYRVSDKTFVASNIYALNKASLYAGSGSPFTLFQDPTGNSQTPTVTYDRDLSTMYILESWGGNSGGSGRLRLSTITGAVGSEVLTLGIAFPSTPNTWDGMPAGGAEFMPQLGSSRKIVAGDDVIQNSVYRNGSLWCVQTVFLPAGGAATRSALQWWQLTTGGSVQQRGRLDDASGNIFYGFPSIAVNQNNDVLIGYSQFSSSQYAGAGYAFRGSADPAGTLRTPALLKTGQAPYYKINGGTRNKWGDYSNTVTDPANDIDFWTIQEYAAPPSGGADRWGTWWGLISPSNPPPATATDVVLYASEAPVRSGSYQVVTDASAAGGARLHNPDAGAAKIVTPPANPTTYFDITFPAQAATAYRLWVRGRAQGDYWGNDSVFVQFSDSVTATGSPTYRIGTTSAAEINLEDCSGCGLSGWGWQDNGWGVGVMGPLIYFQSAGTHTLRVQVREDGLSIDQIVLSPSTYLNASPGALKNDATILPKSGTPPPPSPPTITSVSPTSGTTTGGTSVTISGANFAPGATVSFGGATAPNVTVANASSITATTPAHAAGTVNVVVTNPDHQAATLTNGYTYTAPPPAPAPTVNSVTPNSGPAGGGTSVTISGSNFTSGASVTFGGAAATGVTVSSGTTMTAVTPARSAGTVSVVVTNGDGQSGTLAGGFTYLSPPPPQETILLAEDFNDNQLDASKWVNNNLFSGFTDAGIASAEVNQRFEIGPMLTGTSGSHYNGIRSASMYNFTGAYCYVELVRAPAANTTADAMLTIGRDVNEYYRIYVEAGVLYLQKRLQGNKVTLSSRTFDAVNHRYWRIRHDVASGAVTFAVAADSGGTPGTWTQLYSEPWNTARLPLTAVTVEIKAGTWQREDNAAGKIIFDNFKIAKP